MSNPDNNGRERAYRALRESEELHRATLGSISDAVFITDDDGRFTFICPNVDVIFGYVPDEVQALGRIDALLGRDLFDSAELAARHEIQNIEREVTTKPSERRTLLIHVKSVSINGGTVLYTCRDITVRKRAQDQLAAARVDLAHLSRLALVGELVASIAHEVNQPLTAVVSNASTGQLLLEKRARLDRGELRELFADILDDGRRAADVVDRLRALVRKRPLERRTLDLNEIATDTLRLIEHDAHRRHVTLRATLASSLPTVSADRVCLQQVLLNLALNAMDAMEELDENSRELVVETGRFDDTSVELAVTDTGCGIPLERMPKIFEPFFTTKEQGIGLGLRIAQSIVEAHDGRIWAESPSRGGTIFHVSLPTAM